MRPSARLSRSPKQSPCAQLNRLRTFADRDHRAVDRIAAAVCTDALSVAESSRDVSDPTFGTFTLAPESVRGSLTSRDIDPEQAAIVERIFRDFVAGVSPEAIVQALNREGMAGPFGGTWSPSTVTAMPSAEPAS